MTGLPKVDPPPLFFLKARVCSTLNVLTKSVQNQVFQQKCANPKLH